MIFSSGSRVVIGAALIGVAAMALLFAMERSTTKDKPEMRR